MSKPSVHTKISRGAAQKSITRRSLDGLALSLGIVFHVVLIELSHGDSFNARIRGMTSSLESLVSYAEEHPCSEKRCVLPLSPFELSISSPHTARLKILITDAVIKNPLVRSRRQSLQNSKKISTRPILLRGIIKPEGTKTGAVVPISGTIFRDSFSPTLNIVIPLEPLKRRRSSGNFASIRAPIFLLPGSRHNAFSSAPTAYAYPNVACGIAQSSVINQFFKHPSFSKESSVGPLESFNIIYLATDYDTLYPSRAGCSSATSCNNKILSEVHNAAVFYENQLGYTFEVAHQFSETRYSATTISEDILDEFSLYNFLNREQYLHTGQRSSEEQADIFSLFTGKVMNDGVIGIAYVGTACRDLFAEYASTVVEYRSPTLNPVILAHEIGHSLDASHTASGIMQPSLGSPPPSSFTVPSLNDINGHLSTYYDECRQGTADNAPSDPFEGSPTTLTMNITRLSRAALLISLTPTALESGCSIKLHAAAKKSQLNSSEPIYEFVPNQSTSELRGAVRFRVKTSSNVKPFIYFKAQYACPDNDVREVSARRRYNPNRGKANVRKIRSKGRWISAFTRSLTIQ